MKAAERIALRVCGALMVAILATIVDGLAIFGSPAYAVPYPAARLCGSLQSGMELSDAEGKIYQMGRIPASIKYRSGRLVVFSMDSGCILDIDPTTKRIAKITISAPPGVI